MTDRTPGSNGRTDPADRSYGAAGNGGRERLAAARRVLEAAGIGAPVRAVGVDGEIVAVTGPPELRDPLARLTPELQALGFRFVALEPRNGRTPTRDS